jgi:uncharacterized RDD family membrane protein YckC
MLLDEIAAQADVQVTLASRVLRLAAVIIDSIIVLSGQGLMFVFSGTPLVILPTLLALALGAVQIIMLSKRGQTIAKWLLGLAIVDQIDKQPPGFVRAALIRALPQMVLSVFLPIWSLVYQVVDALPIFGADRRCIHDRLAGTIVIKVEGSPL